LKIKKEITIGELLFATIMILALFFQYNALVVQNESFNIQKKDFNAKIKSLSDIIKKLEQETQNRINDNTKIINKLKKETIARIENNTDTIKSDTDILRLFNDNSKYINSIVTNNKLSLNNHLSRLTHTVFLIFNKIKNDKNISYDKDLYEIIQNRLYLLNDYIKISQNYTLSFQKISEKYNKNLAQALQLKDNKKRNIKVKEVKKIFQNDNEKVFRKFKNSIDNNIKEYSKNELLFNKYIIK